MPTLGNRFRLWLREVPTITYLLVILVGGFSLLSKDFASPSNFSNLIGQASVLVIVSMGQLLAIMSAGIDLSVGSLIGLSGTVAATLLARGVGLPVSIIAGVLLCSLCGLLSGVIIAKARLFPFVVTFGMLFIAMGINLGITKGGSIHIADPSFEKIGYGDLLGVPVAAWIALGAVFIVALIVRRSTFGPHLSALGAMGEGAWIQGVDVVRCTIIVYFLSGVLAGVAGIVMAGRVVTGNALIGQGMEFNSIAAVVLGGTSFVGGEGSIFGTLVGALVITTLSNGLSLLGLRPEIVSGVAGLAIMACVAGAQLLQRRG